ncbi:ATP-binding protein [Orrella sp. JC864]|uniref:ATP-binding protein n=1 Tax=Orrella sp. JC864 TaxID=3120298 RepID=UPI00300B792C
MAACIQKHDWSSTVLGPPERWPACLKQTVSTMLSLPVPAALLWGQAGVMLYNDGYVEIAGSRHPGILGRPVLESWPEEAAFKRSILQACLQGNSVRHTGMQRVLHRNGRPEQAWLDLSCSPVRDESGQPQGVLVLAWAQPGAARNESEERLRQSQKMEAIGKLTGGVAHDFNNVLQVISGNLHLLSLEARGNERIERRLKSAATAVGRGAQLASQLLAFARRQPLNPASTNLGRLVRAMDEMLRRVLGESVQVHTVIADDLWNTLVDGNQLENAVLNLVINARDAMDGHGELTIEARNARLDASHCRAYPDLAPGDYVMLAVSDNGCGMPPEVARQAFEPFFTTKPAGLGTGLGLSMVHGFVNQSGGHVHLYSEVDVGTTVRLYLPRSISAEAEPETHQAGPVRGGKETILLVEDDEQVRNTAHDLLRGLGYTVLKASDPDQALRMLEGGAWADLLFTDVVMPGRIKSPELARRARQMLPLIEVLYTSGYTADAITQDGRLQAGVELLSKPYGREELARKVRQVLDRRPRAANQPYVQATPGTNGGDSVA